MSELQSFLFAGLCHIKYDGEPFDFGHGVFLRSTYAHFFAVNMIAFARTTDGQPHPGPWHAAKGGFSYDIEAEIARFPGA